VRPIIALAALSSPDVSRWICILSAATPFGMQDTFYTTSIMVTVSVMYVLLCCSSARQSHAFDEGIVAWRVISKQILLRP
jgi:hypothetical protein